MDKIINDTFSIGDRFRGLVDGNIYTVGALPQKGDKVCTPSGGTWYEKSDSVVFIRELDGRRAKVGSEMAKRLLLERVV